MLHLKSLSTVALLCLYCATTINAAEIPAPQDIRYPGTLTLSVDLTDLDRRLFMVRESVPVKPGPLTLLYPQWLPGTHGPNGPVNLLAGLIITARGRRLPWLRDPVNMYAFHIDVPAEADRVDLDPAADVPVYVNIVADNPSKLEIKPEQLAAYRKLMKEAYALYGTRSFDRYDFLLALTENFSGIGLEHHRSSENVHRPGHFTEWDKNAPGRDLLDTTNQPILGGRRALPFPSWQRTVDYYNEGVLLWLDVDTKLRELTGNRRSLDDFARAFFGTKDKSYEVVTYTFDDVVATL